MAQLGDVAVHKLAMVRAEIAPCPGNGFLRDIDAQDVGGAPFFEQVRTETFATRRIQHALAPDKVLRRRVLHDVLARTIGMIGRVRSLERQSLRSWTQPLRHHHHAAAEASVDEGANNPATRRANSSRVCRVAMQSNAASDIAARSYSPLYSWAIRST